MSLRRHRAAAAGFFVLLVLLIGAERRLAEAQLNYVSSTPAFENDWPDGDEIRVRLVLAVEEVRQPDLTGTLLSPWAQSPVAVDTALPTAPLRWSSSRSPPRSRPVR
jgi:hypothetical protein